MKKLTSTITKAAALIAAGVLATGVVGCTNAAETKGNTITIEVVDADGNTTTVSGTTEKEFLKDAIEDIDGISIDGYDSDWGYYITAVNEIVADYDADGAYWSIYVNGAYGENGVDTQPVADGDVFKFVYTVYVAEDTSEADDATGADDSTDGDGSSSDAVVTNFTVEVYDADGNVVSYEISSTAEFLHDAVLDVEGLEIGGYDAEWGYYLTTINGLEANYDEDKTYWSIYVNGEYGAYGIDEQPVKEGDVISFKFEKAE